MNIYLQRLASIQKRTSPLKFDHFAVKSEKGSISNLSTKLGAGRTAGEGGAGAERVQERQRVAAEPAAADGARQAALEKRGRRAVRDEHRADVQEPRLRVPGDTHLRFRCVSAENGSVIDTLCPQVESFQTAMTF